MVLGVAATRNVELVMAVIITLVAAVTRFLRKSQTMDGDAASLPPSFC